MSLDQEKYDARNSQFFIAWHYIAPAFFVQTHTRNKGSTSFFSNQNIADKRKKRPRRITLIPIFLVEFGKVG